MQQIKEVVDSLVSEYVMGWSRKTLPNNDDGHPYYAIFWVDENGVKQKPVNFWNPSTDLKDAWEVVKKLRERGILISVETLKDKYKSTYDGKFGTYSESESLAICIASLKASGLEIAETYSHLK